MTKFAIWQVDAFTETAFKGNPAAVLVHNEPLEKSLMQNIASEMNLSETAFIFLREGENPLLRWFTPNDEIDLCGHATLAAAQIYFSKIDLQAKSVIFDTLFAGPLEVSRRESQLTMCFPLREGKEIPVDQIPSFVYQSLSEVRPIYARQSRDLMLVYKDEETINKMQPNFAALKDYKMGIVVTAPSSMQEYDFVSRYFCAYDGTLEDPVTGSAHCTLAPYWGKQLGKKEMVAFQASPRGGTLFLNLSKERLLISGKALILIEGVLSL